jgi:hypothetical protein
MWDLQAWSLHNLRKILVRKDATDPKALQNQTKIIYSFSSSSKSSPEVATQPKQAQHATEQTLSKYLEHKRSHQFLEKITYIRYLCNAIRGKNPRLHALTVFLHT